MEKGNAAVMLMLMAGGCGGCDDGCSRRFKDAAGAERNLNQLVSYLWHSFG